MKYLLMVYFNGAQERMAQLPSGERDKIVQEFIAFYNSPEICDGNQLQPPDTGTTVRARDGETETRPGPSSGSSDEPLGGYYLIDADDLDSAAALAARIPALRFGGAAEVRPVVAR